MKAARQTSQRRRHRRVVPEARPGEGMDQVDHRVVAAVVLLEALRHVVGIASRDLCERFCTVLVCGKAFDQCIPI
jgi:hypothetical protein